MRIYPIPVVRKRYMLIAKQLNYDELTYTELSKATTEDQMARIMERARLRRVKSDYELDAGRR